MTKLYDNFISSIERDTHDTTPQKALNIREHADCNQKMQILHERLNECREQINKLPGIGCTKEEQLKKLESLRQQLTMKKDLLMKYKHNCNFDTTQKLI